jgi:hypothetical protein
LPLAANKSVKNCCAFSGFSPSQSGDWIQRTQSGREIQVKRFGRWLVSFWLDAPVLELRVVDVKKVVL